ncbi:MAG TPA: aspartate carbamoyltransferase catalytic subunit [candidate division WOR-3 bacterium]|uniref:Aspartate carbamoyltransferase n=1 Tax=candidate division WOR-3 bacterium TaxID=2052148 RepID=A0A9C9EM41_UNCW3|nr:aspartate carbamoyltransferase catalytic subunit [candidate division WOR-3 bacterium]
MNRRKDLLGIEGLTEKEIMQYLNLAEKFAGVLERPIPIVPSLRGKTILTLFFEPSTRTQISFSIAAKRLSADILNFSRSTSSVTKGETLLDTAKNIEAMKVDGVVVRHPAPGAAKFLGEHLAAFVINAGDGAHEHPTQALLDLMTIKQYFGGFKNLKVLIVGDIAHSRVARSNIFGLKILGAQVGLCAPPTLIPLDVKKLGVDVFYKLDDAIGDFDVVMALRLQLERQEAGLFPSIREYRELYGLTKERVQKMKPKGIIMHPGPTNRGVEIDPDVADSDRSVILNQVKNGVATRMAVLFIHSGGRIV